MATELRVSVRAIIGVVQNISPEGADITRSEAQKVMAIFEKLKSESGTESAPLYNVFQYLVLQQHSGKEAAKHFHCSESLITKRKHTLRQRFNGLSIDQLKRLLAPSLDMSTTVKGDLKPNRRAGAPSWEDTAS